jgi:hypothetical protein
MGNKENVLFEPKADYEKAEMDLLQHALERTSAERFDKLMQLIKLGSMFQNAKITHKPYLTKVK